MVIARVPDGQMVVWGTLEPPGYFSAENNPKFRYLNGYGCKGQLAMDLITQVSDATGTINTI